MWSCFSLGSILIHVPCPTAYSTPLRESNMKCSFWPHALTWCPFFLSPHPSLFAQLTFLVWQFPKALSDTTHSFLYQVSYFISSVAQITTNFYSLAQSFRPFNYTLCPGRYRICFLDTWRLDLTCAVYDEDNRCGFFFEEYMYICLKTCVDRGRNSLVVIANTYCYRPITHHMLQFRKDGRWIGVLGSWNSKPKGA